MRYQNATTLTNHISRLSWRSTPSWTGCEVGNGRRNLSPVCTPKPEWHFLTLPEPSRSVVSASPGSLAAKALMSEPLNHPSSWQTRDNQDQVLLVESTYGTHYMPLCQTRHTQPGSPCCSAQKVFSHPSFCRPPSRSCLWKPNSNDTSSRKPSRTSPLPTFHKFLRSGSHPSFNI